MIAASSPPKQNRAADSAPPQFASLIFLAGAIDTKQTKLEQAITLAHRTQIRGQLADLTGKFQELYASWMKSGTGFL